MQQERRRKNEDHANSWRVSSRLTRTVQLQTHGYHAEPRITRITRSRHRIGLIPQLNLGGDDVYAGKSLFRRGAETSTRGRVRSPENRWK
jgi:hypothetical protein